MCVPGLVGCASDLEIIKIDKTHITLNERMRKLGEHLDVPQPSRLGFFAKEPYKRDDILKKRPII